MGGINDGQTVKGSVSICLRGSDGRIKDRETVDNLVVASGRQHIADQLTTQDQAAMTHMAVGTDATASAADQLGLLGEVSRVEFSKAQGTGDDAHKVVYIGSWPSGSGSWLLTEAGLFNSLSGGNMLARVKFDEKSKGTNDSITITWTIIFNA